VERLVAVRGQFGGDEGRPPGGFALIYTYDDRVQL
jgi:hypothetical protein